MFDSQKIRDVLSDTRLNVYADHWIERSTEILAQRPHGDMDMWSTAIQRLPQLQSRSYNLNCSAVTAYPDRAPDRATRDQIEQSLKRLRPWRKGPFNLFGVEIDSEWRSDLKWDRLKHEIAPLEDRLVLDVGCGNGYYLFRMLGAGAKLAMGIDPTLLFTAQFAAITHFVNVSGAFILPMKSEDLAAVWTREDCDGFDTVFSMGIYYHRRSPMTHLKELFTLLRPGGELILETLIIEGSEDKELNPEQRYAQMRNVWSLPTVVRLEKNLIAAGFEHIEVISEEKTTESEQRRTEWMQFESLADFLDPQDSNLTVEGYQAPVRACLIAHRPEQQVKKYAI